MRNTGGIARSGGVGFRICVVGGCCNETAFLKITVDYCKTYIGRLQAQHLEWHSRRGRGARRAHRRHHGDFRGWRLDMKSIFFSFLEKKFKKKTPQRNLALHCDCSALRHGLSLEYCFLKAISKKMKMKIKLP